MTAKIKHLYLFVFSTFIFTSAQGQIDTNVLKKYVPPLGRQAFHDQVNAEQTNILKLYNKGDKKLVVSANEDVNFLVTKAATVRIDWLQYSLEKDSTIRDQKKVRYLRGLTGLLKNLQRDWKSLTFSPVNLPAIITAYEKAVELDKKSLSILSYIKQLDYATATPIVRSSGLDDNADIKTSKEELIKKYCILYPEKTLLTLYQNPDMPFADSLIRLVAKKYPKQLYDYAQANNKLGFAIRKINNDNFITTVVKMAGTKDGQQYFCFLDNILQGKVTLQEIDAAKDDSVKYYKLLVKTHIDYVVRAINKDTAFGFKDLYTRLEKKAKEGFVNVINGLHDLRNLDVRFKSIQALNAQELYYLAVTSDGSMYTSSFVKGVYPLMMKKINNRGDSLLMILHFDRYRKFIKIAAGFNSLDVFLSSFPKSATPGEDDPANTLMKAFVKNLEKSDGIEDGVDVADSYASISETLQPVAKEMLKNIQDNYQRNLQQNNKKGIAIYNILNKLFLSADTSNHINLTTELKIPPVYEVPYKDLTYDSSDKVAIQLFIYGDKDGIGLFPGLVNMFNNSNWKIDQSNKQWVTITAAKGKPVSLYMNRPLTEVGDEDAKAQAALCTYLEKSNIIPKVTINRGHSYNAPYTIEQMSTASKIVFMGSCGGYRSIHDILEKAPDAHIIGTKQIADAEVNNPFLKLISEKLRTGSNIDWKPFWIELAKIATDPIFEDYVPPHKNLGALFIKAYKIAMEQEEGKKSF